MTSANDATIKTAGQPSAVGLRPVSGISARAVLLGLLLVPLNVWWDIITEVKWYSLDGSCLPIFVTPVFIFFCLVLLNFLVRRINPKWAFNRQELLVVYIMLVTSEAMCGHDMLQNLMGIVSHPFFYASPSNKYETLFFRFLPRWLFVTDKSSLDGFYYGGETMYQWRFLSHWLAPLAIWSFFVLVLVGMMLCLNVMLRQQWTEKEKLTYPIVQLPLRLADPTDAEKLFRNRLTWIGFGIAFAIGVINGFNFLNPSLPKIPGIKLYELRQYFTNWPWNGMGGLMISMYPFMIGLAFFLPTDLAFSCWFFFLFRKFEQIVGTIVGWQSVPGFPFFKEQASGAWICLAISALWITRRHLLGVFKKVFGLDDTGGDEGEPMPYRWALGGFLVGMGILTVISWLAGMTLWAIAFFFGIYFLLALAISRVRAEFGAPHEIVFVNPQDIMATTIGTKFLPPTTMAALWTFYWFNRGYRNHPMPNQLEAFKMAQMTKIEYPRLVLVMLLAAVAGMIFTYWAHLYLLYQDGAILTEGYKDWVGYESFDRLAGWFQNPTVPDIRGILVIAAGFIFTFLLKGARNYFFNWPFHPAGYALAVSYAMDYFWFCFFIAWLIQTVLARVGGIASRRAATPFFIGLILGDFTVGCIWSLIGAAREIPSYRIYI